MRVPDCLTNHGVFCVLFAGSGSGADYWYGGGSSSSSGGNGNLYLGGGGGGSSSGGSSGSSGGNNGLYAGRCSGPSLALLAVAQHVQHLGSLAC
jgi:hypothetical protein